MEDFNKTNLSHSSPNHHSLGNNENESENERNLQQKNKNFMSPTISAASKMTKTPNKQSVFKEWKSSPRSDLSKMGNSNSGLRAPLPKIPSFRSLKNVVNVNETNDERDDNVGGVSFDVLNTADVPYDPLTNYLSPRPRFLRYRPSRKPKILDKRDSLSDSVDSHGSSSVESSSEKGNGEVVIIDDSGEGDVVDEEDSDSDEFEEVNEGFRWVVLKGLLVFFALCLSTMWICSKNSSYAPMVELRGGLKIEGELVGNMSLRFVSLRIVEPGIWVLGEKLGKVNEISESKTKISEKMHFLKDYYEMLFRLEDEAYFTDEEYGFEVTNVTDVQNGVKNDAPTVSEVPKKGIRIENLSGVELGSPSKDGVPDSKTEYGLAEAEVSNAADEENGVADSKNDYYSVEIEAPIAGLNEGAGIEVPNVGVADTKIEYGQADFEVNVANGENWVADFKTEYYPVEMEAPIVATELNEGTEVEVPNAGIEDIGVPDSEIEYYQDEIEAQIVASELNEEIGSQDVVSSTDGMEDAEVNSKEVAEVNSIEVQVVAKDDHGENQSTTVEYEPKIKDGQMENLAINEQIRLTLSDLIWPVISPLIAFSLFATLLLRYYSRHQKASSTKTRSLNVGKTVKSRPALPPRVVGVTNQYLSNASFVQKFEHSELNPLSSMNPQENFDRDIPTIIPKVKQLGEYEVGVDFAQPLKGCSMRTERVESIYSTPDTKTVLRSSVSGRGTIAQPSSSEMSTAESYSCGSYISKDTTSMNKDVKEEMTKATPTPRRSTRLRNKGVTSP